MEDDELQQFISIQTEVPKRVESFTFKNLSIGMIMLAAIKEINEIDLVVNLPNNLKGFINITEISDTLTELLKQEEETTSEESNNILPDLTKLFSIGQIVRCVVIQLESTEETRNRVELSLRFIFSKQID